MLPLRVSKIRKIQGISIYFDTMQPFNQHIQVLKKYSILLDLINVYSKTIYSTKKI